MRKFAEAGGSAYCCQEGYEYAHDSLVVGALSWRCCCAFRAGLEA